jgi:hypothetical protein
MNPEQTRLLEAREKDVPWRRWGPYLSERQWGTVREDYSLDGNAWCYFTHDHARSRAYRWGEDGIGGICDDGQRLCFALALWNGKDPILKERLFGLTNAEGNHGEDCKEYYYYLDSTPTHSYMKFLYKYPHEVYPYEEIVRTNGQRGRYELEYELIDTGVFQHGYFDVLVEYAKQAPDDILIQISVTNRGEQAAKLHLLPTLWFRNTWSWADPTPKPQLCRETIGVVTAVAAAHRELGAMRLYCADKPPLLFTENETNCLRCFGSANASPHVKDGINDFVVHGRGDAINPAETGTKAAALYEVEVEPGQTRAVRLRLAPSAAATKEPFGREFDATLAARRTEADEFYQALTPPSVGADAASVMRQAFAGMLWGKQYYYYDISRWLRERFPDAESRAAFLKGPRNTEWTHMVNADVISMPDKWEYPWYAAWDLAFHCVPLAAVDPDFAKQQILLMLKEHYLHPSGQMPAYEWNFGDVNPPVHAWAALYVYNIEKQARGGAGDVDFLKGAFQKLLLNFTWWVNRKDRSGRNVFEGGFLGLDNIGVFDRSSPLPTGGYLEQADGTAWMAFFSQCMLEMAIELAHHDAVYEDFVMKFTEHFLSIASAMDHIGEHDDEMWDEDDGFFYDVLRLPNGAATRLKVRSMVGLLSLCATTVISPQSFEKLPRLVERLRWFLDRNPHLLATIANPRTPGVGNRRLLALLNEEKLRRVLAVMLDEKEFLSPFGIRALSRHHAGSPFTYDLNGQTFRVEYVPAESDSGMFGGNSNWRGPIWMPVNVLLFRGLMKLYAYYGDDFKVECPTGSGVQMTLFEVAREIGNRLIAIFTRDADGRRPVFGGASVFQTDPNWRDHVLFYEYFHGDNGAGLGASHQTGWTGAVASIIQILGSVEPADVLTGQAVAKVYRRAVADAVRSAVPPNVTVNPVGSGRPAAPAAQS